MCLGRLRESIPPPSLIATVFLLFQGCGGRAIPPQVTAISEAFSRERAVGTMVIRRLSDGTEWVHSPARADSAFLPASTFKIANAAIALETGAVSGPEAAFPWDGEIREFEGWNRDHTLASAMPASVVPVYQEVARRVGTERMEEWLARLEYGNGTIDGGIDRFWLDGGLRISAREQVGFLTRLLEEDLPLSRATTAAVVEILRLEGGPGWALHGKTGWAFEAGLGWWVGWAERDGATYVFALNMEMPGGMEDAPRRVTIGRAALEAVGALPPSPRLGRSLPVTRQPPACSG